MTGNYDGLIVLGLIVLLLVFGLSRLRRRIHIPWATGSIVVVFILVVLMFWAVSWA
ncbi:hypothetical protein J4H86_17360 [Spiractinospora alimapuensis]|uniref:hypothetical protein n=1 Tax=Spiractinospora alimapuensis TaxID=2820884 RepID=UPI001F44A29E|nr:hypothetical protein [Spiractinospora alimapuensis]QVQ50657.1 hypothetical protein J4H86_17360 [Spiractinospora alimapuensis]